MFKKIKEKGKRILGLDVLDDIREMMWTDENGKRIKIAYSTELQQLIAKTNLVICQRLMILIVIAGLMLLMGINIMLRFGG